MPEDPDLSTSGPERPATDLASGLAISETCADWRAALPDLDVLSHDAIRASLVAIGTFGLPPEISLAFADDETVRGLNRDYRDMDKATNVLSFPLMDGDQPADGLAGPVMLGDVILAFGTVRTEAAAQQKSLAAHTSHLVVHGVLHLLGHDHDDDDQAEVMEALERKILASLAIDDPYQMPNEKGAA
ncbi:MAG: rRNA maturation RNase YbeY [Rhodospirillaceae bacterium]|nr:rRNA maturation RNase YbeY [Rhodospirillaceae bacterium]